MALTKQSIETLLDLVEIKLSCLEVIDREDARELKQLQVCREELVDLRQTTQVTRRRGRPRNNVVALHY